MLSRGVEEAESLPDRNNCYGELFAPDGLAATARRLGAPWRAALRRSGYDGSVRLQLEGPGVELESEPLGGNAHLFDGAVAGDARSASEHMRQVSRALADAQVAHRLELYAADDSLMISVGHAWPPRES